MQIEHSDELLLEALGGDKKLLEDFRRFQSKEKQRQIRKEIEIKTQEILDGELREENDKAIEIWNKVYRKAWALACEALGRSEEEFPSRY